MEEFRNELLKRREVSFSFEAESNPGFEKSKQTVADKFKVHADNVVVRRIINGFGSNSFMVEALLYDSIDEKNRVERKAKVKKAPGVA